MKKNIPIFIVALILSGCSTLSATKVETETVEVPIAVPCKAILPDAPTFNFDKVATEQSVFEKVRALLADNDLHLGYETELLAALNSCIK